MFIGRENESAVLGERLGQRRPVVVLGEAGIGKTTLVRAAAESAGLRLVEAGALATLSWLPYLPLRRAFGHEFDGDPEHVAAMVETELGDAVLFADDLQWSDGPTLALLPLLAGRVQVVAAVRRGDAGTPAALETAAALDAELLPLGPLAPADATALTRLLHPELSPSVAERLADRAGGNPFLLEQLPATGEASTSLRLAVAARLRSLTAAGIDALAALALLGRPAEARLLGAGAAELLAAGLATAGDEIAIRHALLAETTIEVLDGEQRRRIHSRLASALDDLGEAARHHAAAGETADAYEKALRAATQAATPGERAAHLALASACVEGERASHLRVEAARAMLDAGEASRSLSILDAFDASDEGLLAEAALVECAAAMATGDGERARAAWRRASQARQPSTDFSLRLRLLEAEAARQLFDDTERGIRAANEAYELARSLGRHEHRALCLRGRERLATAAPGWQDDLERAIEGALAADEPATAFDSGKTLVFGLMIDGRPDAGAEVAERLVDRARELKMTGWERDFRASLAGFYWHAGVPRLAADITADLGDDGWFFRCQALVDLARFDEATAVLAPLRDRASTGQMIRQLLWAESDIAFWGGRVKDALRLAEECLALPGSANEGAPLFARLTKCWAAVELEVDPGPATLADRELYGMGAAMPIEEEAVLRLLAGDPLAAADRFDRAAALWRDRHARGELRCLWGRGEALRRAADERAVHTLEVAEERAIALDGLAVLARIRRSLRLAGARRSAPRTRANANLTGREQEVLDLVAQGLTNDVIARRLGLGQPTVARLIQSAQQKLGARTRAQAAALARRR